MSGWIGKGGLRPGKVPGVSLLVGLGLVGATLGGGSTGPEHSGVTPEREAMPANGGGLAVDERISVLVDEVSEERLRFLVDRLAGFETRHTLSSTDDPERGIGAAREWMVEELESYSDRLEVELECFTIPPQGRITREAEICNVKAVLPGRSERRVYVSGHYDSIAQIPEDQEGEWGPYDNPAPGANDDASGTALTMELARVLSQSGLEFDATLVFIGFAGEEQGLFGARLHAEEASDQGRRIDAVFNNDVVGNTKGGNGIEDGSSVRVFSPGPQDSPARQLARYIRRHAGAYTPFHEVRLIAREDRFGRGGDHTPFNWHGFAAVRFTEPMEDYSRQHTVEDTPDGVDEGYLARNARVNVAGVGSLALAPAAPEVDDENGLPKLDRGETGYDARLRWERSPGAVAYRIFIREAWTPDWEHIVDVGDVDEWVFPDLSIDAHVFGVAAVGPDGQESLVAPYVRPPREAESVEVVE